MCIRPVSRVSAILVLLSICALGDNSPQGKTAVGPMSSQTRMDLIRAVNAELVYARRAFPMGTKPLILKDGQISPSEEEVKTLIAMNGTAVKPGDPARITRIDFKKDEIFIELNGGPKKGKKWYQRIEVGGIGGSTPVSQADPNTLNAHGSAVRVVFDKYVPEMSLQQFKDLLKPLLNFDARSAVEAYLDTVPPKVKEAIRDHQVLVGMDREMVTYAKGRPPRKIREKDAGGTEYEEWIYGQPPQDVEFVRFVGDEVTRLEIMKVSGDKIVKTEKEIDLGKSKPELAQGAAGQSQAPAPSEQSAQPAPAQRPTLRRPGEPAPPTPSPGPGQPIPKPPAGPGQSTGIPPQ